MLVGRGIMDASSIFFSKWLSFDAKPRRSGFSGVVSFAGAATFDACNYFITLFY